MLPELLSLAATHPPGIMMLVITPRRSQRTTAGPLSVSNRTYKVLKSYQITENTEKSLFSKRAHLQIVWQVWAQMDKKKKKKTGANPDSLSQSSNMTVTAMGDGNLVKIDNVYTENISYMESWRK